VTRPLQLLGGALEGSRWKTPTSIARFRGTRIMTTSSRWPRREGSGPMELGLVGLCPVRPGLGIPLASTDTPSGGIVSFGYDDRSLVCVRRARCSSLAARSSASSSCYRA
jgi:hypothetical protein